MSLNQTFAAEASTLLTDRTTADLCAMFDLTEKEPYSQAVADVRGSIMAELEHRNPVAYSLWIDEGYNESPGVYFLREG